MIPSTARALSIGSKQNIDFVALQRASRALKHQIILFESDFAKKCASIDENQSKWAHMANQLTEHMKNLKGENETLKQKAG